MHHGSQPTAVTTTVETTIAEEVAILDVTTRERTNVATDPYHCNATCRTLNSFIATLTSSRTNTNS